MQRPPNSAFGNLTKVQQPHSFLQASVPAPKCTRQVSTNGARTHIDKNYLPSREIKRESTASSVPSVKAWRSVQSPKIIVCFSRPSLSPPLFHLNSSQISTTNSFKLTEKQLETASTRLKASKKRREFGR